MTKLRKSLLIIAIIIYIFFLMIYRDIYEIFGFQISPILLIGYFFIILSLIIFLNLNYKKIDLNNLEFKFISENFIKIILLILMIICLFIPSKNSQNLIILWDNVSFLNFFRASIFILGCTFLPGSSIYSLLFNHNSLSKKFKINSFIIKITLYPLISLAFIGVSVLILDQLNLEGELIGFFLFIFIVSLFLFEIVYEKKRSKSFKIKVVNLKFSKSDFIIILLALGVSTVSIGFQIGLQYIISGDPWGAIKLANYIGETDINPLTLFNYPNFWGYVSFGLGILGGLPYININTLLASYSYLFITSTFLLMKTLLYDLKTKYTIFSTILLSIFSGFFIFPPTSSLIFVSEFYFIYKSFSYFLLFVNMALFIVLLNNINSIKRVNFGNFIKNKDFRLIILSAFFIVISFMTYMFPLLFSIIFLFLYCLFSPKNKRFLNFKYFQYLVVLIILFFTFFDILMNFYLSNITVSRFLVFFNFINLIKILPAPLLTYSLFTLIFFITSIIQFRISRNIIRDSKKENKNKVKYKIRFFLTLFSILLIIEFFTTIIENLIINISLDQSNFVFFYLDKIILNLGTIGILGIYLSYYFYESNKRLFLTLFSWIMISFIIAFLKISVELIINSTLKPIEIPESDLFIANYWFDRIWFYAIPSLCIFSSFGFLKFIKKLKRIKILDKNKISIMMIKNLLASSLIIFSFSGIIFTGFSYGDANFRYTDTQIETLSWVSENIPVNSGILVGDNFFMGVGTKTITFVSQYFYYDIFKEEFNISKCIEQIGYLKNKTIQYAVISQFFISYYLNKSDFTNTILIPNFYNITLYQNGDLSVHYAPYFN